MTPIELNEDGKAVWTRYSGRLSLVRDYRWVDGMILIDEVNGRTIITSFKFSTFDFEDWKPMSKEEYKFVLSGGKLWERGNNGILD